MQKTSSILVAAAIVVGGFGASLAPAAAAPLSAPAALSATDVKPAIEQVRHKRWERRHHRQHRRHFRRHHRDHGYHYPRHRSYGYNRYYRSEPNIFFGFGFGGPGYHSYRW